MNNKTKDILDEVLDVAAATTELVEKKLLPDKNQSDSEIVSFCESKNESESEETVNKENEVLKNKMPYFDTDEIFGENILSESEVDINKKKIWIDEYI